MIFFPYAVYRQYLLKLKHLNSRPRHAVGHAAVLPVMTLSVEAKTVDLYKFKPITNS